MSEGTKFEIKRDPRYKNTARIVETGFVKTLKLLTIKKIFKGQKKMV